MTASQMHGHQIPHSCERMVVELSDARSPVIYIPKYREFGIQYRNDGEIMMQIRFCPWCGKSLPESLRDRFFDRLDELNLEPEDDAVPDEMRSDEWWRRDL